MTTTPPNKSTAATSPPATLKATNNQKTTTPTQLLDTSDDVIEDNNHQLEFLFEALKKLNPEKNDLNQVPKEITSSILTTRLRGVCRINRHIDYANDLCHSFAEFNSKNKYQECIEELRDWILDKKIIEHIFGPNCHVEIIKQSHTILSFVAHSLDDDHVNVIWSASLLKHCGRQVLDLLTSLVRYMRTGPVLHLYWLVNNLSTEEHTEHTLLLASCILRYIWLHSPCINQVHFCGLNKNRLDQATSSNGEDQENGPHDDDEHQEPIGKQRYSPTSFSDIKSCRRLPHQERMQSFRKFKLNHDNSHNNALNSSSEDSKQPQYLSNYDNNATLASNNESTVNTTSTTTSTNDFSLTYAKTKSEADDIEWYNECMNQSRLGNSNFDDQETEASASSRSTSENEADKDLNQSLLDALKGVKQYKDDLYLQQAKRLNSPVSETLAKGGGDNHQPADDVKQSVVDHILRSISAPTTGNQDSSQEEQPVTLGEVTPAIKDPNERWLRKFDDGGEDPFLEYSSDVSACCSEDKNMGDFDDDAQGYIQDENTNGTDDPSANSSSSDIYMREMISRRKAPLRDVVRSLQRDTPESTSVNKDPESKPHPSLDPRTEQFQQLSAETVAHFMELKKASLNLSSITNQICADDDLKKLSGYNLANLSEPGKTLLWDLLQDGKIEHLGANLYIEIENALVNLVMSFGDRFIRYKFIEACLENLSLGRSVIVSLRLLPRFMSFSSVTRAISIPAVNETYTIVLWAEQEHHMSTNFFKNLVDYYNERRAISPQHVTDQSSTILREESEDYHKKNPHFTHLDAIITRMTFLSFIYSKSFSPISMKLNQEQMDQLWDCLTSDSNPKCCDVLFQWIYQQAVNDDSHGVDDDLLDYILKCKLPTLPLNNFRLRGLKLLEQLLWIRQDYECCHELEHPATRLLWDTSIKAGTDEVCFAASRILNHFYIYTNHSKSVVCKQGSNFMRYCMEHLNNSMLALKSSENVDETGQALRTMQKVMLLMISHLEVFKAHWSFYLRTLQLNRASDLMSHRHRAYDIKLTTTIRLVIQAASTANKTTLEMQASDYIGELRAEIVNWWYSQVDRSFFNRGASSPNSSSSSAEIELEEMIELDQIGDIFGDEDAASIVDEYRSSKRPKNFTNFALDNLHTLRLLSHNQEIPIEWDERQINELDFKDLQVIYVLNDSKSATNMDSADDLESEKSDTSLQAIKFPDAKTIPPKVLLEQANFERLMEVDKFLGKFRCNESAELTEKAKNLSRRVWEIIQFLPTSPDYLENLNDCGLDDIKRSMKRQKCSYLFSADCPQRLLYSLQIIDLLKTTQNSPFWDSTFISLADLYDVLMSQKLLPDKDEEWNEWLQECLAHLLKLIFQFGIKTKSTPSSADQSSSSGSKNMGHIRSHGGHHQSNANSSKKLRRNRNKAHCVIDERAQIPLFSEEMLRLLENTELIFSKLIQILEASALSRRQDDHFYYTAMSSRAMIVHHVMNFLSSWCKSDPKFPEFNVAKYENLVKALILDDTDPSTRRETCCGFLKLHHASMARSLDTSTTDSNTSVSPGSPSISESPSDTSSMIVDSTMLQLPESRFSADLLACLIKFLPIAEGMRPPKPLRSCVSESDYIREMNMPGAKDYFWLTCKLIEAQNTCSLSYRNRRRTVSRSSETERSNVQEQPMDTSICDRLQLNDTSSGQSFSSGDQFYRGYQLVDLYDLCRYLVIAIRRRPTFETRDYTIEDETLRGMLMMMVKAIRRDPRFRYSEEAEQFILELYCYLFAPPTERYRYLPKCKAGATRSIAFELMVALVEQCPKNYIRLLELLIQDQHSAVAKVSHPADYWPHDDCRSEVGFVGLVNLGATCYLATCMQHLFMIPDLRYAILSIQDPKGIRHGEIMRELQKIFAFMLESERKAYNPRNFCKVYTMDNHPLNIAEQTDMTEFLTDLITKIEESSPVLRQIIKSLFSGTLSNNVVSLDCPHISRTTEEFYTLRVQVADMRNLNDSLDELTVKDTLEGDNMYTCSTCEKKVRAEKRACIVKLPRILCFNTMRYTFNMTTMTKEKVNTHFSFPLKLDMADYLESNLMKRQQTSPNSSAYPSRTSSTSSQEQSQSPAKEKLQQTSSTEEVRQQEHTSQNVLTSKPSAGEDQHSDTLYELIGVTVHTGNADGGHYYCFIRDCEDESSDKPRWYLFNDAEVKPFDDSHLGTECYGGELTTKSYDAVNDRFMDFSIEKTNSAYMLFYKRVDYKYRSKSVALRYLESDTQRNKINLMSPFKMENLISPLDIVSTSDGASSHVANSEQIDPNSSEENEDSLRQAAQKYSAIFSEALNFDKLCQLTYDDFVLPRHLANWIWNENLKFSRDQCIFEHNYFDFMWQICANVPRTLNHPPKEIADVVAQSPNFVVPESRLAIETMHLAIVFVLGVLINSREKPNLGNWTDLIKKQFNSSQAACDWAMQLIEDDEAWLKHLCPSEMAKQLFQRVFNDLTNSQKQHKKIRLVK